MSPKNFTHELLIGWGGEKVFAHGLRLGNGGSVVKAEWDPATHKATGEILLSDRGNSAPGSRCSTTGTSSPTAPARRTGSSRWCVRTSSPLRSS